MEQLSKALLYELEHNILPFWMDKMIDKVNGGFLGRIDGYGNPVQNAEKGAVLNARILWAFSAAYRVLRKQSYLEIATRAKDYFVRYFIDREQGGVYWSLDKKEMFWIQRSRPMLLVLLFMDLVNSFVQQEITRLWNMQNNFFQISNNMPLMLSIMAM